MKTFMEPIVRFNERIAVRGTIVFGSMWVTYMFFLYGLAPLMFPARMNELLYWSNTIQLWSLPLLMVGTNLLGRTSEARLLETHDAVMTELDVIKEEHEMLRQVHVALKISNDAIHEKIDILTSSHEAIHEKIDAMKKGSLNVIVNEGCSG